MPMLSAVQEFNGGWLGSLTASFVRWWLVWCVGGGGVLVVVVKWCLVVPVTAKQPTPAGQMQPRQVAVTPRQQQNSQSEMAVQQKPVHAQFVRWVICRLHPPCGPARSL